ncbi:hypothetical protein [Lichenibacterium dinghuense]|uniref:hypothetical protein n=1 Tax=Lichenibacterium dinghuense TaxID=2895977 RepID=UPI001F425917|nr:hypothetical protein [Lichenibacterium sp. 6Y81]
MRLALCLVAALACLSPALGAPRIAVPPALRQSALLCLGEALRLCPGALAAKDHGVSCIVGKRRLLSAPCRSVYDQGLRLLQGGDLHLQLRPPRKP